MYRCVCVCFCQQYQRGCIGAHVCECVLVHRTIRLRPTAPASLQCKNLETCLTHEYHCCLITGDCMRGATWELSWFSRVEHNKKASCYQLSTQLRLPIFVHLIQGWVTWPAAQTPLALPPAPGASHGMIRYVIPAGGISPAVRVS